MDWTLAAQGWAVETHETTEAPSDQKRNWFVDMVLMVIRCLDVVFCCVVVFVCVRLWKAVRRVQKPREIQREDFEKNLPQEIPGYGAVSRT